MTNLFGPPLIDEFGWEKAQFALIGIMPLATMLVLPLQGRFTDKYGARVAAGIGVVVLPLTFIAYSLMSGNIVEFFAIAFVQALVGMLVGTLAYTRVVVEKFDAARGMALSLSMIGAPAIGAVDGPHRWRDNRRGRLARRISNCWRSCRRSAAWRQSC